MKISTWAASENKNENFRFLIIITLTWLLNFIQPIAGKTYTAWDTHDLGFVNFLYFSDSLRHGIFPLWNHFIQSGTFFPDFNNIGLFFPFQLIFVALSWIISPLYAYELMIQAAILVGGVGSYLLFRYSTNDRLIALFGATAFVLVVLTSIVGQIEFVISLSSFPWIIFACVKTFENRHHSSRYIFWGILYALYIVSGYLWMNLINLMIAAIFLLCIGIKKYIDATGQERRTIALGSINVLLFLGAILLLYASLELPGYLSMHFNYGLFKGDYQSPEPRLRSLNAIQYYSYSNIYRAFMDSLDLRVILNNASWITNAPKWSWGAGWILWFVFLVLPQKKIFGQQTFWLTLMIVALMYSAGNSNFIGDFAKITPIINANRYLFIGIFYVPICLIFIAVAKISAVKNNPISSKKHGYRVLLAGALSLCLLAYFKSPLLETVLVAASLFLVWLLGKETNHAKWTNLLTALIILNIVAIASMPYLKVISLQGRHLLVASGGYGNKVAFRNKQIDITRNFRRLGEGHDYIFNDEQWVLKKIPFSHGYNNLGNPYYWYVKNEPFLKYLVSVTQNIRQEIVMERTDFISDNAFAEAMMGDVRADMDRPTIDATHFHDLARRPDFNWQLNALDVTPNTASMRVTINAPAYLIFNNVEHPGWSVYVNGKKAELVKANRIFQGVFLKKAGSYDVVFKFRPVLTIALILLPYIALLLSFIIYMRKIHNKSKASAN